jgi:hypothetical protein
MFGLNVTKASRPSTPLPASMCRDDHPQHGYDWRDKGSSYFRLKIAHDSTDIPFDRGTTAIK